MGTEVVVEPTMIFTVPNGPGRYTPPKSPLLFSQSNTLKEEEKKKGEG